MACVTPHGACVVTASDRVSSTTPPNHDRARDWFLAILTLATIVGLGAAFGAGAGVVRDLILTVLAGGWVGYGLSHWIE